MNICKYLLPLAMLATLLSCQKESVHVTSITVSPSTLELTEGERQQLSAEVEPEEAENKAYSWTTSDKSVAVVDSGGEVTAVGAGTATIKAIADDGGIEGSCRVTVKTKVIPVESIQLSGPPVSMVEGDEVQLSAEVRPENATYKDIRWTSSDEAVATVSESGKLVAVSAGEATITVSSVSQPEIMSSCSVTISAKAIPVTAITLDQGHLDLVEGDVYTLHATVEPADATDKAIKWTSSNEAAATVSEDGNVVAVSAGEATITVSSVSQPDIMSSCSVTVSAKAIPVTAITLDQEHLDLVEGDDYTLHATVEPVNATDKTVKWKSSNPSIASVSDTGLVTANHEGTAVITASCGNVSATCEVSVAKPVIPVEEVLLNRSSLELEPGQTGQLTATVLPANATDKTVTWISTDEAVATVYGGLVTAISPGYCGIQAWAGGKYEEAVIVVEAPAPEPYVDLGRGTKWATCNLGASAPEEYGNYYAWGETSVKSSYSWNNYLWGKQFSLTKYKSGGNSLELADDVANATLGSNWRMPTPAEVNTLVSDCTWSWKTNYNGSGKNGYVVTGTNGKSIFLPAAGYRKESSLNGVGTNGYYWTSRVSFEDNAHANTIAFTSSGPSLSNYSRYVGLPVRAVYAASGTNVPVTDVHIKPQYLTINMGETYQLELDIYPNNATDKTGTWSSDNAGVATVANGIVTGRGPGIASVTYKVSNGLSATCKVTVRMESVDLGLPSGLKWATCNLGARSPKEFGLEYGWGETELKSDMSWSTYKWWDSATSELTKYRPKTSSGKGDGKLVLDPEDDVAHVTLGGNWRIPTYEEWKELYDQCTWTWFNENGIFGTIGTSKKNGAQIILTCAGYRSGTYIINSGSHGYYWSSSLRKDEPKKAYNMYFHYKDEAFPSFSERRLGFCVRAVCD